VPNDVVTKAGWQAGTEIRYELDGKGRVMMTPTAPKPKPKKMPYDEFKKAVCGILSSAPDGLSWSQIRERDRSLPIKPNALWVDHMERECGLKRVKGPNGTIWLIDPSHTLESNV
jgi:hypothetical protein